MAAAGHVLIIAGIVLIIIATIGFFFIKNLSRKEDQESTDINELVGRMGRVKEKIQNHNELGQVRIGTKNWKAQSQRGEEIAENEIVTVRSIENETIFVEEIKQ